MRKLAKLIIVVLFMASPEAHACSPDREFIDRPLALKLAGNNFFIGKVESVDANEVKMIVIASVDQVGNKKPGESITFKLGNYGTCGSIDFKKGETWLYDGSDISFSSSRKLEPADLKDGSDLEAVKRNLVARLDPTYKTPPAPAKGDMPVPGVYVHSEECRNKDRALGPERMGYKLEITEPDSTTGMYKVKAESTTCMESKPCVFSAEAPPYGYGEIIVPVKVQTHTPALTCSLQVQQLSSVDEWPRLAEGQARVRLNNYSCLPLIEGCGVHATLDSPVLQKQ